MMLIRQNVIDALDRSFFKIEKLFMQKVMEELLFRDRFKTKIIKNLLLFHFFFIQVTTAFFIPTSNTKLKN